MHHAMWELLEETGNCRVLPQCSFTEVEADAGRITRVTLDHGWRVAARTVVDATADLHLCDAAGCTLTSGQEPRSRYGEPTLLTIERPHQWGVPDLPGRALRSARRRAAGGRSRRALLVARPERRAFRGPPLPSTPTATST